MSGGNGHGFVRQVPEKREFRPEVKAELERICERYPRRDAALLPALRLLEREFGCVDEDGMIHVAKLLGISPVRTRNAVGGSANHRHRTNVVVLA